MVRTGPVIESLRDETSMHIVERVNTIMRSNQLQNTITDWIRESLELGIFGDQSSLLQNELLDTLYELSATQGPIAHNSAQLYHQITNPHNTPL